jgi:hypothetical protein
VQNLIIWETGKSEFLLKGKNIERETKICGKETLKIVSVVCTWRKKVIKKA